jgi:hypothetical protein
MDSINIDNNMDFSNIKNKESESATKADTKADAKSEEKIECAGFKKDKKKCTKKSTGVFENKHYCNVHFKQYSSSTENKSNDIPEKTNKKKTSKKSVKGDEEEKVEVNICEGVKKDKKQCTKKSTGVFKNKYYCNVHFKQQTTLEEKEETEEKEEKKEKEETEETEEKEEKKEKEETEEKEEKEETEEEEEKKSATQTKDKFICQTIKKDGDRCDKKGVNYFEDTHYCKTHFNQIQRENNKKQENEDKKTIKEFNSFIKTKIKNKYSDDEFKNIKDTYKKYMLIFHPDKCKIQNIDASELAKSLNVYMDKIKNSYE